MSPHQRPRPPSVPEVPECPGEEGHTPPRHIAPISRFIPSLLRCILAFVKTSRQVQTVDIGIRLHHRLPRRCRPCLSNERRTVLGHSRGGTHFRKHARPWLKLLDAGDIDPLMSRGPRRATDNTDPAIVARSQGATGSAPGVARQRLVTVSVAPTAGLLDWRTSRARGALAARLRLLQKFSGGG